MKFAQGLTAALAAACALGMAPAGAQLPGIGRVDLLQHQLSLPGREISQVRVDFAPGALAPRHAHPGEEVAFVLEGTLEYQIDGQPPVTLKAGQALYIPSGAVHSARNVGGGEAKELATYILEQGKPQLTLAK